MLCLFRHIPYSPERSSRVWGKGCGERTHANSRTKAAVHASASRDTWASIAERELSDQPQEAAVAQLQSWNLHVFARRVIDDATGEMGNPILPSDILFLEPPLAATQ